MRTVLRHFVFAAVLSLGVLGALPGLEARRAEASTLRDLINWIIGNLPGHTGSGRSVPELDPNAAGQAALLVLGGAALLLTRRTTPTRDS